MSQEVAPGRRGTISPAVRHACQDALKASKLADWCSRGAPVAWGTAAVAVMVESSNNFAAVQNASGAMRLTRIYTKHFLSCAVVRLRPWGKEMRLSSVPPGITCDAGSAVRVQEKGSRTLLQLIFRSRAVGMTSFSDIPH